MKLNKYIFRAVIVCGCALSLASCEDKVDGESIFDTTEDTLDPASPTYQLDVYLEEAFRKPYNIQFRYKMQDVGTDMDYNLIPAEYSKSVDLAVLTKYLWFDVYDKVVTSDPNFMKKTSPRIIHLIGSPQVNAANGTITLGLAEGGLKVSLFKVNDMDVNSFEALNEYYFHTMHHEFTHILHQTKTYPKEFDQLSVGHYDALGWQNRDSRATASLGFVTPYASSQPREDFAEVVSNYITMTDAEWTNLLKTASEPWEESDNGSAILGDAANDKIDGKALIEQKLDIARTWLRDAWQLDLDELRAEVQKRQNSYSIEVLEELRKQVYEIPTGTDAQN